MSNISYSTSHLKFLSNAIRILAADAIEQAKSGHPGLPLGMADVMTVLAAKFLKFNPVDPRWFGRDRFVLSAGHGSMLLYAYYYLTGYKNFQLEDIKSFRQLHSKAAGHPEFEIYEGVETTTGPLGQGFANSVGMAIAQKKYKLELEKLANYKIYCIVGDGCLMEGIGYEAASLAGHLNLNNLIVLFDDNNISIDGPTNLTVSEDHLAKFKALGWEVERVNGHDYEEIEAALTRAQNAKKPYFIAFKTIIGYEAGNKAGSEESHGAPLGAEALAALKQNLNWALEPFFVPEDILDSWRKIGQKNIDIYNNSLAELAKLPTERQNYIYLPDLTKLANDLTAQDFAKIDKLEATRISSGVVVEHLLSASSKVIVGSADLSISNGLKTSKVKQITADDFSGNFIHYGVRENAMAAIMNGLAIENFLPIGGSFLVFSDYMRPGIRLAAIMGLPVIYVMTHDSIGVGEDGPTHQPVEHLASLRAMPNLRLFRPADRLETIACWQEILGNPSKPSMLALTRQALPQLIAEPKVNKGAYLLGEEGLHDVAIWSTGSEVSLALEVKQLLKEQGFTAAVISCPCLELFLEQNKEYQNNLFSCGKLNIAIEAASHFGWERILGREGLFFGVNEFGKSAPASKIFEYFGLNAEKITAKIIEQLQ